MMSHSRKISKSGQSGQGFQKQRQGNQNNGNKYHYNAFRHDFTDLEILGIGRECGFDPYQLLALCCLESHAFFKDLTSGQARTQELYQFAERIVAEAIALQTAFYGGHE